MIRQDARDGICPSLIVGFHRSRTWKRLFFQDEGVERAWHER